MGGGEVGASLHSVWGGDVDKASLEGKLPGAVGEAEGRFSGAFYAFPMMCSLFLHLFLPAFYSGAERVWEYSY